MATKIDLSKLSLKELKALDKDIAKAITSVTKSTKAAALADAEKAAQKHGFTLKELMGTAPKSKAKKAAAPAKYKHPENAAVTWSGRGRQPAWFKEAIAKGTKPESLAI